MFLSFKARSLIYIELIRLNKPIGILLLLWPTLWALWAAKRGVPDIKNLVIFIFGVILMRSAGCAINDYADRDFDGQVGRTKNRPLATNRIASYEALLIACTLSVVAFFLVLMTNIKTVYLSFFALVLASIYPFMKRVTYFPQVILGAAFAWAIPMAFMATNNEVSYSSWILYGAALVWTVSYDTLYAMVDKEDDIAAGIKSIALFFGEWDRFMVGLLQLLTLVMLFFFGLSQSYYFMYYGGLLAAFLLFLFQQKKIYSRKKEAYFSAFIDNHWVGLVIFLGFIFGV